jgi:hypothetical protein
MKTKYVTLLLIAFIAFACNNDDDNNDESFLTANNYISENNFYSFYLESEISLLQVEIDSLQAVIDDMQGDATTQTNLDNANQEQGLLNADYANLVLKGNPIPLPPPPPPCPDSNTCFPIDALYLITLNTNNSLEINIFDEQNVLLGSTDNVQLSPLPGFNSEFSYQSILLNQYSGPVTIMVEKLDAQNNPIMYSIAGYAQ